MRSAAITHDHVEGQHGSSSNFVCEDASSEDGVNQGKGVERCYEDDDSDLSSEDQASSGFIIFNFPPPPPPPGGSKILRAVSVPCSSTSSPQTDMVLAKSSMKSIQREYYRDRRSHPSIKAPLYRQHSEAVTQLARDVRLQRSKSCNDGRSLAPPDDFDLCPSCCVTRDSEAGEDDPEEDDDSHHDSNSPADNHHVPEHKKKHTTNGVEGSERFKCGSFCRQGSERFKCGSFCISLPRLSSRSKCVCFSKRKCVCFGRHRRKERLSDDAVSRIVSLEKFECGSWDSSALKDAEEEDIGKEEEEDDDDDDNKDDCNDDIYYDLPLEKITKKANDTNSPVKATFVFERAHKGVLKREGSRLSTRSSTTRHVRFTTPAHLSRPSSPSRIV